ncbi:MAG: alpha-amylase [Tissierellia bacterium]|nr:alpha-amylase [Tissierellia bacterium]
MENAVMLQGFEWYIPDDGNHFKNLKELIPELKKSGFDSIWLPPFCKATGTNDNGYGIYDLYDLGEFDQKGNKRTKYGTREDLIDLIDTSHKNGILVYADIVMNHKAGADYTEKFQAVEVDPNDRTKDISDQHEIEGWTGFDFPGRKGKYSEFKWNFNHFTGVDMDNKTGKTGIFRIVGENKGWAYGVSGEKGNFDYLMFANIDHSHPDVFNEFKSWTKWLVDNTKVDGFRIDAAKHIDDIFMAKFIDHVESTFGPDFYCFGEYWVNDPNQTGHYLYETEYNLDIFDVGLHFNLFNAAVGGGDYDLRKIFDNSVVKEYPTIAVTFVDNHDSQPGEALSSFVDPWFKRIAYGLILLRKDGYPCVFYGDYYGIKGDQPVEGMKEIIDNLIFIRKNYAYGEQDDYFEDPHTIGFVRKGNEKHPGRLAVAITNRDRSEIKMNVGKDQAGKIYRDLTGQLNEEVTIDEEGNGVFIAPAGSISAWANK